MGMLAKKATEKKAALASGLVGFPTQDDASWDLVGRVRAGAIIREAALDLKLKGKYSNVNKAGRHNMIAGAVAGAMTSTDTVLWVRETGRRTWQVWIGAAAVNGNLSIDWLCEIRVDPGKVSIATPKYWSENGTMLKVKLHDEFRRNVFERMAAGRAREPGDSVALSKWAMAKSGLNDLIEPLGAWTDEFGIESSTAFEQIALDFFSGGFGTPRLGCGDGRLRFGLGMPDGWPENWVEMTAKPLEDDGVHIDGLVTVSGTGAKVTQLCAIQAALTFWERLQVIMKARDPKMAVVARPSRIEAIDVGF
jgi:hypothetical protein